MRKCGIAHEIRIEHEYGFHMVFTESELKELLSLIDDKKKVTIRFFHCSKLHNLYEGEIINPLPIDKP